jgi:hypothetical protein
MNAMNGLDYEVKPRSWGAFRWARLALLGMCLALTWRLLSISLAGAIGGSQPEIALLLDSARTTFALQIADRALSNDDPKDLESARDRLLDALRRNPLAPQVLTSLALLAEQTQDPVRAESLMRLGGAGSARDVLAHSWLLDYDLRGGEISAAVRRVDLLLRAAPRRTQTILQAAMPILTHETAVAPLAEALAAMPPWREAALRVLTRNADTRFLWDLYEVLQKAPVRVDPAELQPFLERLVRENQFDAAFLLWSDIVPPERLARADLLFNGRFQYPVSNLPFDWTIRPVAGALVRVSGRRGGRALNIDFFGARVPFRHVSHLMMLSPGDYRFVGLESATNLRNERGMRWRITCGGDSVALAETPLLVGEIAWRPIAVDFTVPEDCVAQNLVLELAARVVIEQEVSGGVSYMGLGIEARPAVSSGSDLQNMN